MNSEFLIAAYIISMAVDWILQWEWQANNKSRWGFDDNLMTSFVALSTHSFIYGTITTLILRLTGILLSEKTILVFLFLFISHIIIDTRIPVKFIMKLKGMTWEQIYSQDLVFLHIGIDHRLHEIILLWLSFMV